MTFPTVPTSGAGRVVSAANTSPSGTHTFPNLNTLTAPAGDLILAIVTTYDGNSTNAEFSSWGGGFTEFVDQATTATMGIGVAYKFSSGSETGTFTVTSADTSTNDSQCILVSIAGAHGSTAPEGGTITNGTSAAANLAALNPSGWDVEDTLWVAICGSGEDSTTGSFTAITAAPANYTDLFATAFSADVVGGVRAGVGFRQFRAASDDPATFTVDVGAARNSALLVAVRPAVPDPLGPVITAFETTNWTTTTTPLTITVTGAVTGDLIVVPFGGNNGTAGINVTASSVSTTSGSTGSWTELEEHLASDSQAWVNLAYATVTADGDVTVSLARTQATGNVWGGWAALCHNHGGIGVHGNSAPSATETVSLTVEQDSAVIAIAIDWDALTPVAFSPSGAVDVERAANANVTNYAGYWSEQAAGTRGYGIATSSTTNLHINAVEVKASSGAATATPATVAAVADVPAPTKSTGSTIAAVALAALAAVGTPTVSTGNNATVATTTVAAVAAVPAPTVITGTNATPTPATVAAIAAVGAMEGAVGSTVTPPTVAAVTSVGMPVVTTGSNATVTPATVAAVSVQPAITIHTGTGISPATVAVVAAVPVPTVQTAGNAAVTPAAVAAVAGIAAVTVHTGATVSPTAVPAIAAVPAAILRTGSTVIPPAVAATAAVAAPSISVGGSATIATTTVAAVAGVGVPTVQTGSRVTTIMVAAVAGVPVPTVTAGSDITIHPTTVAAVAGVAAPTITRGTSVSPPTVAVVAGVGMPTLHTGSTVIVTTVPALASIGAPAIIRGATAANRGSTLTVRTRRAANVAPSRRDVPMLTPTDRATIDLTGG